MGLYPLLSRAVELVLGAQHITVLTGAGISTPSGIPDFRSERSGLWQQINPFQVASLQGFRIQPQSFFDWIRPLANRLIQAAPNPAHVALAQLEKLGLIKAIITQNIDTLHQKAGSRNVIEVHGHIRQATCVRCYHRVSIDVLWERFSTPHTVPRCERCGGVLKPNVILFGEQLPIQPLNAARHEAQQCDLMLIIGTSLSVAPISDLPLIAKDNGADLVVINREPTPIDAQATLVIYDDLVNILPRLVTQVLNRLA